MAQIEDLTIKVRADIGICMKQLDALIDKLVRIKKIRISFWKVIKLRLLGVHKSKITIQEIVDKERGMTI